MAATCVFAPLLASSAEAQQSSPIAAANGTKTAEPAPVVRDVRLQANGRLQLRLLDTTGQPRVEHVVRCLFDGRMIAEAKTDSHGRVTISNLRPGIHSIAVGQSQTVYRLWNQQTAPPSAITSPAIVASDETMRGQYGYGPPPMIAPGVLAAGITIAAIVAVIAGKNSGSKSQPSTPASP